MKASYDAETDALFVRFTSSPIVESEEVSPDFILDFDKERHIVGIEILNVADRLGDGFSPRALEAAG